MMIENLENPSGSSLDSFERRAIDQFRANCDEDVVVSESKDEILIVGALRQLYNSRWKFDADPIGAGPLRRIMSYRLTRIVQPWQDRGQFDASTD